MLSLVSAVLMVGASRGPLGPVETALYMWYRSWYVLPVVGAEVRLLPVCVAIARLMRFPLDMFITVMGLAMFRGVLAVMVLFLLSIRRGRTLRLCSYLMVRVVAGVVTLLLLSEKH